MAPVYIRFPQTDFERNLTKTNFFQSFGFPGVLGVIDGTHVAISAVLLNVENAYVNRRGYHSINAQVICNANLAITNVNARFPGATHDAFIFNGSQINNHLENVYHENPNIMNFLLGKI